MDPRRLQRIRFLSRLLDNVIPLPGGFRIGLDPIIGLFPYLGELTTTSVSFYLLYEAARLGLPKRLLAKMVANIFVDSLVGSFPVLGDVFDFIWKSNSKNVQIIETAYHPGLKERPARTIVFWIGGLFCLFLAMIVGLSMAVFNALMGLFHLIF